MRRQITRLLVDIGNVGAHANCEQLRTTLMECTNRNWALITGSLAGIFCLGYSHTRHLHEVDPSPVSGSFTRYGKAPNPTPRSNPCFDLYSYHTLVLWKSQIQLLDAPMLFVYTVYVSILLMYLRNSEKPLTCFDVSRIVRYTSPLTASS